MYTFSNAEMPPMKLREESNTSVWVSVEGGVGPGACVS